MKKIRLLIFFFLLLQAGLSAQAASSYVFPDNLPSGCSIVSSGNYSCGVLTLAAGDTVTIALPKPATISFSGALTVGDGVLINSGGLPADLELVVNGVFTLGANAAINANVTSTAAVTTGIGSTVGGNLTATSTTGVITLGANSTVGGYILTDAGAITIGDGSTVGRNVTSTGAGVVTLTTNIKVGGNVSTDAGAITIGDQSTICGNIAISGAGVVKLTTNIKVGGNVSTIPGAITIGAGSKVNGNVVITGAGVITLTGVLVGGNISTTGAAITLTDSRVGGSATPIGAVTLTTSVVNDTALYVSPACTPTTPPVSSSAAGAFECVEKGTLSTWVAETTATPTTHRLYTKLAGTPFSFDVVALKTDGTIETNYVAAGGSVKSVTLELVDGSSNTACTNRAAIAPAVSQGLSFSSTDAGRKTTVGMTVSNAYADLRCRITDANQTPSVVGCSSDNFAVRPTGLVVTSSANADTAGASANAAPAIKAGANFTLAAASSAVGYNAAPKLDVNKVAAHVGAVQVGTVAGSFSSADPATGMATGTAFSYGEVGYFKLDANGIYDDAFTAVDSAQSDCTPDFSNSLVGGKYGCKFGNAAPTSYFGRFYPDHFAVTLPVFTPGCGTSFTYMGQPFVLSATVEAQSVGGGKTKNFNGVLASATVMLELENANNGIALDKARLTGQGTPTWMAGAYPFVATGFSRGPTPDGAYDDLDIGLQVISTDTVLAVAARPSLIDRDMAEGNTSCTTDAAGKSDGTCTATRIVKEIKVRYGRIKLQNAYGSERNSLQVPIAFEYWTVNGWVKNSLDTCTILSGSNFAFAFPVGTATKPNNLAACNSALTVTGSAPAYVLMLSKPSSDKSGWADVTLNLGPAALGTNTQCTVVGNAGGADVPANMPWLQYNGTGATGNPKARATFGVFKSPLIYRRENY